MDTVRKDLESCHREVLFWSSEELHDSSRDVILGGLYFTLGREREKG